MTNMMKIRKLKRKQKATKFIFLLLMIEEIFKVKWEGEVRSSCKKKWDLISCFFVEARKRVDDHGMAEIWW